MSIIDAGVPKLKMDCGGGEYALFCGICHGFVGSGAIKVSNKSSESGHIKSKSRSADNGMCGRLELDIVGVWSPKAENWDGVG